MELRPFLPPWGVCIIFLPNTQDRNPVGPSVTENILSHPAPEESAPKMSLGDIFSRMLLSKGRGPWHRWSSSSFLGLTGQAANPGEARRSVVSQQGTGTSGSCEDELRHG